MNELTWQDRAKAVAKYHAMRCKEDDSHTLVATAKELGRSLGRISEDITIAKWMKEHPRVEKFPNSRQALDWIKSEKKKMKVMDA